MDWHFIQGHAFDPSVCKSFGTSFRIIGLSADIVEWWIFSSTTDTYSVQWQAARFVRVFFFAAAAAKKQRSMDICATHPFYSTSPVGQLVSIWQCASRETLRHTGKLFWLWLCSFWFVFDVGLWNVLHTGVDQRRIVQWRVAKTREAGGPGPCMHLYYMQGKGWIRRLSFILPWTAYLKEPLGHTQRDSVPVCISDYISVQVL